MNTDEIRRVLRILPQFDDVYSSDTLPPRPHGLLVCNLDPAHCPGTHWVAIYIDGDYGEYFDSIGRTPPDSIRNYLDRWCGGADKWILNDPKFRASSVKFADITVFTVVCLEVTLHRCAKS